jgi:uncharacterized protein DUF4124
VTFAAALALGAAGAHAQQLYKCVVAGKVTYQETRCPGDAREDEVKGLPPPGDPGAAAEAAAVKGDPEDPHMLNLVAVLVGYEGCTRASPEFAEAHAAQYAAWRTGNAKYLARLERSPRYQEVLANGRRQNAAQPLDSPEFRDKYARFCNVQFIPMMVRNTPR